MDDIDIDDLLDKALENNGQVPIAPPSIEPEKEKEPEKEPEKERSRKDEDRDKDRERRGDSDRHRKRRHSSRSRSPHKSRRSRSRSPHDRRRRPGDAQRDKEREKDRDKRKREYDRIRQREDELRLTPAEREAVEIERDQRTVFVFNLPLKADEDDIGDFFSKVGKVRDIRLITDRNSRRSKGVGYVEFYDRTTVPNALTLSGTPFMGQIIQVQVTQAEKNRQAAASAPAATTTFTTKKLYIGPLHPNLTEDDLKKIFSPFGDLDFINLHKDPDTGKSKGFAFIQYRRAEDAKRALDKLNGQEIAGRQVKVGAVNETVKSETSFFGDLDDDDGRGVKLNVSSRVALMEKLQRSSSIAAREQKPPEPVPVKVEKPAPPPLPPVKISPSPCVKLTNMFNPSSETEANWDQEIKEDTQEECSKFGSVVHIFVDRDSQGDVYLKFGSIPAAQNAINALDKRWFASRMVTAEFIPEKQYYGRFPEAKNR